MTFHGREEERVWQAALAFRARLDGLLHSEFYRGETAAVLGPAPASVARINYHYRCRLTLSCVNTRRLRELLAFLVREFAKDRSSRGRRRVCGCQRQRIKGNHDGTEEYFDRRGACAAQDGTAVTRFDAHLGELLDDMRQTLTMRGASALAAPQIGILRRVVVVDDDGPS